MQIHAGVAELVDALDLGSSDESCGGSSPSARTKRSHQAFARRISGEPALGRFAEPTGARPFRPRVDHFENCPHANRRRTRAKRRFEPMQVTETLNEGLKHEFKINVPAADLDAKADAKLVDLKDKVKLNGFRPGKVPVSHLKKVYGRSVMAETIDQTIRDTNTQIFTDRGFRLATEPKITMPTEQAEVEELLAGKTDLTYTVAIEVVPTIQLADFKTFSVEKPVVEVTDAQI